MVTRALVDGRLVDFAIEPPPQGATPEAGFEVLAWVDFGRRRAPDAAGCFDIALKRARLRYEDAGCQPASKAEKPPHWIIEGDGWLFQAAPDDVLRGRQLSATAELMRTRATASTAPEVRLLVECEDEFDLRVVPRDGEARPAEELLKVAQRFLQKCARNEEGSAGFGEAVLRWGVQES